MQLSQIANMVKYSRNLIHAFFNANTEVSILGHFIEP